MSSITERLCAAKSAYHQLLLGQSPRVVVDQNGERVEFTAANRSDLKSYIESLESELAGLNGSSVGRGPMNPFIV